MQTIRLEPVTHRNTACIGIYFASHTALTALVKRIPGVRWSQTLRCWWIPLNRTNYYLLINALDGHAIVNSTPLLQHYKTRQPAGAAAGLIKTPAVAAAPPVKKNAAGKKSSCCRHTCHQPAGITGAAAAPAVESLQPQYHKNLSE